MEYEKIKLIENGPKFLAGLRESPGFPQLRVVVDPYFLPNGRVRFHQLELPEPS